jgi:putative transposase
MSENLIPLEPGNIYHIFNHAVGNENLFIDEPNYIYFISLFNKYIVPYSEVISFILMPNHFHFLIKFNENNTCSNKFLSNQLSKLFNAYSQAFNKRYGRKGSLFIHRYRRKKVNRNELLKNLIIYINTNSIHHGFTQTAYEWKYSSLNAIVTTKSSFIKSQLVIDLFDNLENFKNCIGKDVELENILTFE